jgi:hypothetical protein
MASWNRRRQWDQALIRRRRAQPNSARLSASGPLLDVVKAVQQQRELSQYDLVGGDTTRTDGVSRQAGASNNAGLSDAPAQEPEQ